MLLHHKVTHFLGLYKMMPVITLEGCSLKHEAWRPKKKKSADIYNLEDDGRVASKLISSIFRSETGSSVCQPGLGQYCVCYFPAVVRITTFRILMGWKLCSDWLHHFNYDSTINLRSEAMKRARIKLLGKALDGCHCLHPWEETRKLGHPNSTFPKCTHSGHVSWSVTLPQSSSPKPFPASWPLRCSSNPSLTPHPSVLTAPESWADVSAKHLPEGRQRQVSHIWKVSRILKELSPLQSSLSFVALKVWLTITYNVSWESRLLFFFSVQVSLWAEDLGSIRKNLVLLWDLASSCRMRGEWPVRSSLMNSSFPWLPTLEVQRRIWVPGF